jgi:predicted nucleic acid-binding protein
VRQVVSDTGPVLHLREAGASHLLEFTGCVHIPKAVNLELERLDAAWGTERPAWVSLIELTEEYRREALAWQQAGLLGPGESEAIALARQVRAGWLLTDDAAARLVARSLGLEVHGSLGVVLWAAAVGHLGCSDAEATLARLTQSSLWMSARVIGEARAGLRQLFEQA